MGAAWDHAVRLHRAVAEALASGDLRQAAVSLGDYEGARDLVRRLWTGDWKVRPWRETGGVLPAYLLLGFLAGYFFYRDLPENDHAFWPDFLRALGLDREEPTLGERDLLWDVLRGMPNAQSYLRRHADGSRDFVGTLDALFSFRALRLQELLRHLRRYREDEVLPEALGPYKGVVRGLKEALDLLAEEELTEEELGDMEALVQRLARLGYYPEDPHPVRFLFHRSPSRFQELYREWRQEAHERDTRFPQVRVEVVRGQNAVERILPQLQREPLLEGARVYGQVRWKGGAFTRFSWVPRLDQEGNPIPEEVRVPFWDGREEELVFRLHHQAWGVRFRDQAGRVIPSLRVPGRPQVVLVPPGRVNRPVRFLLESGGDPVSSVEEVPWELVEPEDALLVEVQVGGRRESGDWRPLGRLPLEREVELLSSLEGGEFVLRVVPGAWLQVEWAWPSQPPAEGWGEVRLKLAPWPGEVRVRAWGREFRVAVPASSSAAWWRRGIGLGRIMNP